MERSLKIRIIFLLSSIMINSFSVSLFVKSNLGTSTNSSIPLVMSLVITRLSLGMATILFNALLLVILMFMCGTRKEYLVSLLMGLMFGTVLDIWNYLWTIVPIYILGSYGMYAIAFFSLPIGIALTHASELPTLPFDYFVKGLAGKIGKTIAFTKTVTDFSYVAIAIVLGFIFLGRPHGIGFGTIVSMLFTGYLVAVVNKYILKSTK